jgi:hypothetical protein
VAVGPGFAANRRRVPPADIGTDLTNNAFRDDFSIRTGGGQERKFDLGIQLSQ